MQVQVNTTAHPPCLPSFSTVAWSGADKTVTETAADELTLFLLTQGWTPCASPEKAFILFASGGSEQHAIGLLRHGTVNLLVAGAENNAWAAASEVKAYADLHGFQAVLIARFDKHFVVELFEWLQVKRGLDLLKNQRAGLLGEVSDWLVASSPEESLLRQRLGVELIKLPFENLPDYLGMPNDPQFDQLFGQNTIHRQELSSIAGFLKSQIAAHNLNAITIQCFKMVREKGVTACLPLSLINLNGIPAGCEGDVVSMAGLMLLKALTGEIAWMANLVRIENSSVLLAHCTAPLQHANKQAFVPHFETGRSDALQAELSFETVTLFRLNERLDQAFLSVGKVISRPRHPNACRTQLEVQLGNHAAARLREKPLGNHHLVLPGDHYNLISKALRMKKIKIKG